jgi:hypothetical protein
VKVFLGVWAQHLHLLLIHKYGTVDLLIGPPVKVYYTHTRARAHARTHAPTHARAHARAREATLEAAVFSTGFIKMKNSMKFLSHILQYFNLSYGMYDLKLS